MNKKLLSLVTLFFLTVNTPHIVKQHYREDDETDYIGLCV